MYFSNISNEELQHFHRINGVDMSMSLSQIINSNLFNVEAIIPNKLYRVCPLFYCEKIISSNSNDKILDNSCAILQKNEKETYLSFVTNSDSKIIVNDSSFFNNKLINQKLTIDEYNGLVYTLRQQGVLNGNINTEENIIEGSYGTYILNFNEDILRNDMGFIINDELKNNPLSIKLTDPFFINAKYTLTCTVVSLTGANVCDDDSSDYINKDTFSITLVEDSEVIIDLSSYVNDSVLLFDMGVSISFDVPEIVNSNFSLSLVVDSSRIALGESIVLTATLSGEDNVSNYNVQFFEDGNLIDTGTTDSEGIASITFTPSVASNHIYSCNLLGLSSNVNVVVYNKNTNLLLNSNSDSILIDNELVITGVLTDGEENGLSDMSVRLYQNNNLIDTLVTDNNGQFTKTIEMSVANDYTYHAEYDGVSGYLSTVSNIINVNVYKYPSNITLTTDKTVVYLKPSTSSTPYFTYSGRLLLNGEPANNTDIDIYDNDYHGASSYYWVRTNSNGEFSKKWYCDDAHNYVLKAVYNGTDKIDSATSTTVNVVARKMKTYITTNVPTEINYGEPVTITGRFIDELGNPITNGQVYFKINNGNHSITEYVSTNSNGEYTFTTNYIGDTIGNTFVTINGTIPNGRANDYLCENTANTNKYITTTSYETETTILTKTGSYEVGEKLPIQVTSDDPNFNPSQITVVCNGVTSTVTTKNTDGDFLFTIPNIGSASGNVQVTASYESYGYDYSSDTKTIPVIFTLNSLTLSKSSNKLIMTGKNVNNVVFSNGTLSNIVLHFTGFPVSEFILNDIIFDSSGNFQIQLQMTGSGTVYATYNNIRSNTINITITDGGTIR